MSEQQSNTTWEVDLLPKQAAFYQSAARFPGFVGGWGSGKTMAGILKGVDLSETYPNNLGAIFRNTYKDLEQSTMADFKLYTGMTINSKHTVEFPNGSQIVFHHLDSLAGIQQNINFGWFMIEQAEELENEEVFDKLRGRLRRVLTPPRQVQEQLVAIGALSHVVRDFRDIPNDEPEKLRDKADRAIVQQLGIPHRQGFIIANTNGHNWIWRLWKQGERKNTKLFEMTGFENPHLPGDTLDDWKQMEHESPSHFRRYILNSWEDVDTADKCIPYQKILDAVGRDLRDYDTNLTVISCDPAEFGDDKTVIYVLKGLDVVDTKVMSKKATGETAGHIIKSHRKYHADKIIIDVVGIGAGVWSDVREQLPEHEEDIVMRFNSGESPRNKIAYVRARDEIYGEGAKLFIDDYVSIPDDDILVEDLAAHTYALNSKGQYIVARKKDIKKVLRRSPDRADALMMGLWAAKKGHKRQPQLVGVGAEEDYDPLTWEL